MPNGPMPGRHELGQNFLRDRRAIREVVDLASAGGDGEGLIVEWGAGDGALSLPLARLQRPLELVEIDPRHVAGLQRKVPPHVCITEGDILRHAPPRATQTLVCNVPFHITTAVMRRLFGLPHWRTAVLITQWEVARKRAGVGGATQLTAQWWPWFKFSLHMRIPASAFLPRPSADAGLLVIERRATALVAERDGYQRWVQMVFNGRGHGVAQVLTGTGIPQPEAVAWCRREGVSLRSLPRDLTAAQWVSAFGLARPASIVKRTRAATARRLDVGPDGAPERGRHRR